MKSQPMKCLFIFSMSFMLASCISFPSSVEDLKAKGNSSGKVCSSDMYEEVRARVEEYFDNCFRARNPIYYNGANLTVNFLVSKDVGDDSSEFSAYQIAKGKYRYMLSAKVSKEEGQCKSIIIADAMNVFWKKHFKRFESIAVNEPAKCPI